MLLYVYKTLKNVFRCFKVLVKKTLSVFSPNAGKYGPEITPYLDTFNAVISLLQIKENTSSSNIHQIHSGVGTFL